MNDSPPCIHLAFAVNDNFARPLRILLMSLLEAGNERLSAHIMYHTLGDESISRLQQLTWLFPHLELKLHKLDTAPYAGLPGVKPDGSGAETYFRYCLPSLLPAQPRVLYLDADILARPGEDGSVLSPLWQIELGDNLAAGVRDMWVRSIGYLREIGFSDNELYVNAGILLLNLGQMRREGVEQKLFALSLSTSHRFKDQDAINILFRGRIVELDSIWNFAHENVKREKARRPLARLLHFTGQKPWAEICRNHFRREWKRAARRYARLAARKLRVGLIIDEFFGGAGTAIGGYGALARNYIARYLPNEWIEVEVLLKRGRKWFTATEYEVDGIRLYDLPKRHCCSRWWLKKQKYDVYLSVDMVDDFVLKHTTNPDIRLLCWIQDQRPERAWKEIIASMTCIEEPCYYRANLYRTIHDWAVGGRIRFVSQGHSLIPLARELYDLPGDFPIGYLPNPIELDENVCFNLGQKKKQVIFLGRLEAAKRTWLVCEIAKRLPRYDFYMLGGFMRHKEDNERMLAPYMKGDIPNLHWLGHTTGDEKSKVLRESRIMINTSIWEAIPISWLEALACGTLIVSNLDRENIPSRFGAFVGDLPGDGFDGIDRFIPAITELMENDQLFEKKARAAIKYAREEHNIDRFVRDLPGLVIEEAIAGRRKQCSPPASPASMNQASSEPTFSVIVPVYKVEEYLEECLDSLLAQTFRDFELIAVNDGSPDGCPAILKAYAARDSRLRIINRENGGLSAARNTGLAEAAGRYCLFIDSDDIAHPQLLEICHHFLHTYHADFVSFNYEKIAPHAGLSPRSFDVRAMRHHLSHAPCHLLSQRHRHRIPLMAPTSCYSVELARRHPFIEGLLYEDYPHTISLLRDIRTAVILQQRLYGYTTRPSSIMTARFTTGNIDHYRRGLLSIADAYRGDRQKFSVISRIIYPEILKQIGNAIFRLKERDAAWMNMLLAFRALLQELDQRSLLSWRGHKLRRYVAYRRLVNATESDVPALCPGLERVFH